MISPAMAENRFTVYCWTGNSNFTFSGYGGNGLLQWGGQNFFPATSAYKDQTGYIKSVRADSVFLVAIDFNNWTAYGVTQFNDGRRSENYFACKEIK
jgi:hypothetical protein